MKKLIALILALAAVFALGTSSLAAMQTPIGTIIDTNEDGNSGGTPSAPNPADIPGLLICLMEEQYEKQNREGHGAPAGRHGGVVVPA